MPETLLSASNILLFGRVVTDIEIVHPDSGQEPITSHHDPFRAIRGRNSDGNRQLETLVDKTGETNGARFARIYGVSFEGQFYDLPTPMLFLVHGEGQIAETTVGSDCPPPAATEATQAAASRRGGSPSPLPAPLPIGDPRQSRAPDEPSRTGLGAADFSFADDIQVWSYDKADYTIRMDVETGMFEQVLLDLIFDGGGPGGIAGANVRGANVRGANVRGANVRGANVRGANVRGGGGGD